MADLFAPPSQDELLAPPTEEELASPPNQDLLSPPRREELMAPPTREEYPPKETPSQLEAAGLGALQGVSYGWADEVEAALRSLPKGATYGDAIRKVRARYQAAEEAHPKTYLTANIGTGLASSLVPGLGAIGTVSKGASVAKAAAASAGAGALAGFGSGEGLEDSTKQALFGAAIGGTLGAGIHKVLGKAPTKATTEAASEAAENLIPPNAPKSLFDAVESSYSKELSALDEKFASNLWEGKVDGATLPAETLEDLKGFATYLDKGTSPTNPAFGAGKAIDYVREKASRLSKEDFIRDYQDYAKAEKAKQLIATGWGDDALVSKDGNWLNRILDFSYVANDIDQRTGSSIKEALLKGSSSINRYMQDLYTNLTKAKKATDLTSDSLNDEIYDALRTGNTPANEEVSKAVSAWKNFYGETAAHLRSLGVPIQEIRNYVPRKLKDNYEVAHLIRQEVKALGGLDKVVSQGWGNLNDDLRNGIQYLTGGQPATNRELRDTLTSLMNPSSSAYVKAREAAALFARSEVEVPEFLLEKNLNRLAQRYLMEGLKYGHTKDTLRDLAYNKNLLKQLGQEQDVQRLDNLVSDFLGGQRSISKKVSEYINSFQTSMLDRAANSSGRTKAVYEYVAHSPESIRNIFMNVYPNFLGASPKAAIQNLTGSYFMLIPELGGTAGTQLYLKHLPKAVARASSPKGMEELAQMGYVAPQWSTDLLDSFRRSKRGTLGKGVDKAAQLSMMMFEKSEHINRALTYEIGKELAANLNSPATQKLLASMPLSLRKKALTNPDIIPRYLADRVLFSYNKLNQSELARSVGPLLSMFTKYPFAMVGRMAEPYRAKGTAAGLRDTMQGFVGPYLAASMLTLAARESFLEPEAETMLFGKPSDRSKLGQGLAASSPVGAVKGLMEGKAFRAPASSLFVAGAGAVEGDVDKVAKNLSKLGQAFVPGGAYGYYRLADEMLKVGGVVDDESSLYKKITD
jgi:hypothetical protein